MNQLPAQKVDGLIDGMRLLEELHTARFEIAGHFPDEILLNINTPEAFAALPEKGADHD